MTPSEAKRYVIVGTAGAGVLSAVALYRRGRTPTPRLGVGVLATGVILAAGAELVPNIAGGMAVLLLITAAFVVGGDAWAGITAATAPTPIDS